MNIFAAIVLFTLFVEDREHDVKDCKDDVKMTDITNNTTKEQNPVRIYFHALKQLLILNFAFYFC